MDQPVTFRKRVYSFQFRSPGRFHLKPIKAMENLDLPTYPMELYIVKESMEFNIHPLYAYKME